MNRNRRRPITSLKTTIALFLLSVVFFLAAGCSTLDRRSSTTSSPAFPDERTPAEAIKLLRSAQSNFAAGKNGLARRELSQALKISPGFADAHFLMGKINYSEKNFSQSRADFQESIRLNPKNARAYYQLALIHEDEQRPDAAEDALKKALRITPGYEDAHFRLGLLYYQREDFEAAEKEFARVVYANPNRTEAREHLDKVFQAV